jgi:tetratricopeptide (TPR) repeat protein
MAFDKAKVLRAAEKYLSQGNIAAAIKEYSQVIDQDPEDYTTLNMLGDLYARAGQKAQAGACFERIAEHYRGQGFVLKAIAMFKKLDRLNPGRTETARALATLYDMQGLNVEARTQYLIVAQAYAQAGEMEKSLEVLRKVADLEPNNTQVLLQLAEGYVREGMADDAVRAFTEAGTQFHAQRADVKALQAYQRALELVPENLEALQGLVESHITLGTADDAAEVVEQAIARDPENLELLRLLATAYFKAQDASAAERVVAKLVQNKAATYESFVDVARLYLKVSDTDAAVRVLTSITEQMLSGREEVQLLQLLDEALLRDPEQVNALRLLARIYAWQRDDEKLKGALERLLEAAEASESVEEQRYALEQLIRVAPDQLHYIDRLQTLGGSTLLGSSREESWADQRAPELDMPVSDSFAVVNQASGADGARDERAAEADSSFMMFEGNSVAQPQPPTLPQPTPAPVSFADLNEWTDEGAQAPAAPSQKAAHENLAAGNNESAQFQEYVFGDQLLEETFTPLAEKSIAQSADEADHRLEAMRKQELESIDFYLAQGYMDIALNTLELLERQFGPHPEIDARFKQIRMATAQAERPDVAEEVIEFDKLAHYEVAGETASEQVHAVEMGHAFAQTQAAPPHAPAHTPAPPPIAAAMAHGAPESSARAQAQAPATNPAQGIDPGLAALFDEFRMAAEEEGPASTGEDYETHYNLGLAYKDMDLLDEAIEEFQLAAGLCAPQDGTPRYLQCCNLLGHCFMRKGLPRLAVMWFKKGLSAPGHTEDEYQALRYELGMAYEELGDLERASEVFTEVYGINVSYRGVSEKLRALEARRQSEGRERVAH